MEKGRLSATVLIGVVALLYPAIVYFGSQTLPLGVLIGILAIVLLARLVLGGGLRSTTGLVACIGLLFCGLVWLSQNQQGLLYYPVVINLTLLFVFGFSLFKSPTVIEQLARITEPDLPPSGVAYTRKVTWVWMIFFALNGTIALGTIVWGNIDVWALYNGFIAYIAMALLFAVEWSIRKKVRARDGRNPLSESKVHRSC